MSKKIVNGKFVARTAEEEVEFQRLKAEHYANASKTKFRKRVRIKEPFVAITLRQIDQWNNQGSLSKVTGLFFVLLIENFKHHASFQLPTDKLAAGGFSLATQWRALAELEEAGLISVARKPPRPPIITVL